MPVCSEFRRFSVYWHQDGEAAATLKVEGFNPLRRTWKELLEGKFPEQTTFRKYYVCYADSFRHPLLERRLISIELT